MQEVTDVEIKMDIKSDSANTDATTKKQKEKKVKHASAGRILALARPELPILLVATVCLLLSSAASVAMPAFIGFIIAAITSKGPDPTTELQKQRCSWSQFSLLEACFHSFVAGSTL